MKRTIHRWLYVAAIPVVAVLWYLFRQELIFVNRSVSESLPAATAGAASTAKPLKSGAFTSLAHQTSGTAAVHELPDGRKVLRLSDFKTSNGPDVRVYLVAGSDGADNDAIKRGEFLDLGTLKGNLGDQNYELPAEVDLSKYGSVSIWCKRFAVNFGAANLAGA